MKRLGATLHEAECRIVAPDATLYVAIKKSVFNSDRSSVLNLQTLALTLSRTHDFIHYATKFKGKL